MGAKVDFSQYDCIVIGVSAGGMEALKKLLPSLNKNFPLPIIVVQHLHPNQGEFYIRFFDDGCQLKVQEAEIGKEIKAGNVYFAPPNYHLLIEPDKTFVLSVDDKVNFSRPAIDPLFISASNVFGKRLIGIILTGANNDGAKGMSYIKRNEGMTIAQNPKTAEVFTMPLAAIEITPMDFIMDLDEISEFLGQ